MHEQQTERLVLLLKSLVVHLVSDTFIRWTTSLQWFWKLKQKPCDGWKGEVTFSSDDSSSAEYEPVHAIYCNSSSSWWDESTCTTALEPVTSSTCPLLLVPSGSVRWTISAYLGNCGREAGTQASILQGIWYCETLCLENEDMHRGVSPLRRTVVLTFTWSKITSGPLTPDTVL